jgi:hypothetical protein
MIIAIKTNKEVFFTGGVGIVQMEIDLDINRPNLENYEMRIVDSCYKELINDEGHPYKKKIGSDITRFKTMTYQEITDLISTINIYLSKETLVEDVNELFRQGLLLITQKECIEGISGIPNKGRYYSEAQDWEIVR